MRFGTILSVFTAVFLSFALGQELPRAQSVRRDNRLLPVNKGKMTSKPTHKPTRAPTARPTPKAKMGSKKPPPTHRPTHKPTAKPTEKRQMGAMMRK